MTHNMYWWKQENDARRFAEYFGVIPCRDTNGCWLVLVRREDKTAADDLFVRRPWEVR